MFIVELSYISIYHLHQYCWCGVIYFHLCQFSWIGRNICWHL